MRGWRRFKTVFLVYTSCSYFFYTIDKVKKMSSINSFRILICMFVIYVYISPRTKMKMKSHLTGNLNLN